MEEGRVVVRMYDAADVLIDVVDFVQRRLSRPIILNGSTSLARQIALYERLSLQIHSSSVSVYCE